MKQELWIINSSLLGIFIFTLLVNILLQQSPPPFRARRHFVPEREIKTGIPVESVENIYKYDLFGTFQRKEFVPSKKLIQPIPQPRPVSVKAPSELPKPKFLKPLKIELKGIAFSFDEEKSISMIVDESKKENIYHTGDTLKDSQLIRIGKDRITLLRGNGQHETVFLRADNKSKTKAKTWNHLVKKFKENKFELDIKEFPKAFPSIGTLVEDLSLLTVFRKGMPIGVKIAKIEPNSAGAALGLQKSDIITSINKVSTAGKKERLKLYESLVNSKKGDTVTITLTRNKKMAGPHDISLTYKLTEIEKIKKKEFIPSEEDKKAGPDDDKKKEDTLFKLSRLQEREKSRRKFRRSHPNKQGQNAIDAIRQRLLNDIRSRSRNARVR